ncbi:MAG: biopolymer transporter ExbD [Myxococcales bacterium]|nr:biopolymer transporter ExbD [Myxococcales bacterium]
MAGVSVDGGGHGGKKNVDQEIPLVPFIDLLLCCVMFLLVTAVWNQLARISANQQSPGQAPASDQPPPPEKVKLIVQVQNTGYVLATTAGDRMTINKQGEDYDNEELRNKLQERKRLEPARTDITVAPEDGVRYEDVIGAMDIVIGEGFADVSLSDGAALL